MLDELTVQGFGIIEEINWRPAAGLNVITGETGAGKSLVIDAVEALLSGQADEEDIRHGADEARVEGVFGVEDGAPLRAMLAEKGLDMADGLILACDFRRQGRTTPRVNRQAVARSLLKDIGAALVDIHGQSQHLSLLRKEQHREFLDAYAHTAELRRDFSLKATGLHRMEEEIKSLSRSEQELARQTELLGFQIDEIKRAKLSDGEEAALERELAVLSSAEKLKAAAYEIYGVIYGDENSLDNASALDRVNAALLPLKQIVDTDPSLKPQLGALDEVIHGLEELARDVHTYGENLSFDPQRLEEVQSRLELIRGLKRKYGGSVEEMWRYLAKAEAELEGLTYSGERREKLEKEREGLRKEMGSLAARLSSERTRAARKLAALVKKELGELKMGRVDFAISVSQEKSPDGIPLPDGDKYKFGPTGVDDILFMASTNPGEPLKPLDKIASTGEISRFLLALKSALAGADTIPVLIFDEIDIGIGGRSGEVIGQKLWTLARHHQVICVTHLPQIAAFADAQYRVAKQTAGARTVSTIEGIEGEARLKELAVMIAGPRYTPAALNTARELIEKAEGWKKGAS
ncbi:MAG: DNA repair protein RecN [Chloroflexi bacterium RBG_13_57_8]|nr:MAG: DNA repair protein RecN [Chloroflexi bacterium RBG_13_57_8]